ncbi:hypothetical protein WKI68_42265 [Streptomyces sp. MS1.HAVA.3]|uniref:Uncharacterized protein n=1 Tax=Streptomyces caledonius TaxID=3134107 RepID=A0ABU8UDU3_9ACTN
MPSRAGRCRPYASASAAPTPYRPRGPPLPAPRSPLASLDPVVPGRDRVL